MAVTEDQEVKGQLLKVDDVAWRLNVPRQHVWRMARRGDLTVIRVGREMRFDPADIDQWIARAKTRKPGGR